MPQDISFYAESTKILPLKQRYQQRRFNRQSKRRIQKRALGPRGTWREARAKRERNRRLRDQTFDDVEDCSALCFDRGLHLDVGDVRIGRDAGKEDNPFWVLQSNLTSPSDHSTNLSQPDFTFAADTPSHEKAKEAYGGQFMRISWSSQWSQHGDLSHDALAHTGANLADNCSDGVCGHYITNGVEPEICLRKQSVRTPDECLIPSTAAKVRFPDTFPGESRTPIATIPSPSESFFDADPIPDEYNLKFPVLQCRGPQQFPGRDEEPTKAFTLLCGQEPPQPDFESYKANQCSSSATEQVEGFIAAALPLFKPEYDTPKCLDVVPYKSEEKPEVNIGLNGHSLIEVLEIARWPLTQLRLGCPTCGKPWQEDHEIWRDGITLAKLRPRAADSIGNSNGLSQDKSYIPATLDPPLEDIIANHVRESGPSTTMDVLAPFFWQEFATASAHAVGSDADESEEEARSADSNGNPFVLPKIQQLDNLINLVAKDLVQHDESNDDVDLGARLADDHVPAAVPNFSDEAVEISESTESVGLTLGNPVVDRHISTDMEENLGLGDTFDEDHQQQAANETIGLSCLKDLFDSHGHVDIEEGEVTDFSVLTPPYSTTESDWEWQTGYWSSCEDE